MSKCATALGVAELSAWTAAAGEFPRIETFLGYAHLRLNRGDIGAAISANGRARQFIIDFTGWLGGAGLGAVHNARFADFGMPSWPGTDRTRRAVWFIPRGGEIPALAPSAQTPATLDVSKFGCPK